jgi:N-acetylglucosaminyldiphosphoundecaprenol N-acetyl-beta-D-mannosaminyltransferase
VTAGPAADFLGVRVEALTFPELLARVEEWLADREAPSRYVACLNAYCVTLASRDPALSRVYARADAACPDGMPFVFWIRRFVRRECDRLYGPHVVAALAKRGVERGWGFFLYGGSEAALTGLRRHLELSYPGLRIVGQIAPPFRPLSAEEERTVRAELAAARPHVVLVGLGTPKQDFFIDAHRDAVRGAAFIAVGAAFDILSGRVPMAPGWVQRSGFEWLWRLLGPDRRRLWRRYTLDLVEFLWKLGRQQIQRRR